MEESEKIRKSKLEKLKTSEKRVKIKDELRIKELLEKLGSDEISATKYLAAIDSQVSFKLTIENDTEEE